MSSRYKFSEEEKAAIAEARKRNTEKQVERRLKALELRAKGMSSDEVVAICEYHPAYITKLVANYRAGGLEAITGNHYGGNHRNMSYAEEEELLAPFKMQAEKRRTGRGVSNRGSLPRGSWPLYWHFPDILCPSSARMAKGDAEEQTSEESK